MIGLCQTFADLCVCSRLETRTVHRSSRTRMRTFRPMRTRTRTGTVHSNCPRGRGQGQINLSSWGQFVKLSSWGQPVTLLDADLCKGILWYEMWIWHHGYFNVMKSGTGLSSIEKNPQMTQSYKVLISCPHDSWGHNSSIGRGSHENHTLYYSQLFHLSFRTRMRTLWNKVPRERGQHEDTRFAVLGPWGRGHEDKYPKPGLFTHAQSITLRHGLGLRHVLTWRNKNVQNSWNT